MKKTLAFPGGVQPAWRKLNFTLIELIAAMAVFSVLMLALMQFFSSAQAIWINSSRRTMAFENARLAAHLIASDLQNAYYRYEQVPFWHKAADGSYSNEYSHELLAFVSSSTNRPNENNIRSNLIEIKYQLYEPFPAPEYGGKVPFGTV